MSGKEATARIKINKLLEAASWRFFAEGNKPANIRLEPSITIKSTDLDALGNNFEKTQILGDAEEQKKLEILSERPRIKSKFSKPIMMKRSGGSGVVMNCRQASSSWSRSIWRLSEKFPSAIKWPVGMAIRV